MSSYNITRMVDTEVKIVQHCANGLLLDSPRTVTYTRVYPRTRLNCISVSAEILERRKAEILQYKDKSAGLTKKQRYALAVRSGRRPSSANTGQSCPTNNCSNTSQNDVPGPIRQLCLDRSVPLVFNVNNQCAPAPEVSLVPSSS